MTQHTIRIIKKIEDQLNYFINSADYWAQKGDEKNYQRCMKVVRNCEKSLETLRNKS